MEEKWAIDVNNHLNQIISMITINSMEGFIELRVEVWSLNSSALSFASVYAS